MKSNGQPRPAQLRGFTLMELMITVAIVGILSTLAYASYREYVKRSNRAEAKAAVLEDAQFLERNFTEANRYDKDSSDNAVALPLTTAPRTGTALYSITAALSSTSFTVTAAPVHGAQMDGDQCGSFTLNNLGARGLSGASYSVQQCWGR